MFFKRSNGISDYKKAACLSALSLVKPMRGMKKNTFGQYDQKM
jgi:hypothetical protein